MWGRGLPPTIVLSSCPMTVVQSRGASLTPTLLLLWCHLGWPTEICGDDLPTNPDPSEALPPPGSLPVLVWGPSLRWPPPPDSGVSPAPPPPRLRSLWLSCPTKAPSLCSHRAHFPWQGCHLLVSRPLLRRGLSSRASPSPPRSLLISVCPLACRLSPLQRGRLLRTGCPSASFSSRPTPYVLHTHAHTRSHQHTNTCAHTPLRPGLSVCSGRHSFPGLTPAHEFPLLLKGDMLRDVATPPRVT